MLDATAISSTSWLYLAATAATIALVSKLIKPSNSALDAIPSIPFMANLRILLQSITFEEYSEMCNYYMIHPIQKAFLGSKKLVLVSTPDHARQVFTNTESILKQPTKGTSLLLHHFLGTNIVNANGDEWKRQKRAIQPAFQKLFPVHTFVDITRGLVEQWDKLIDQNKPIEVVEWAMRATVDILGMALFDMPFGTLQQKEPRAVQLYTQVMSGALNVTYMGMPFLDAKWNPFRRPAYEASEELHAMFMDMITTKKAQVKERLEKEARGEVVEQRKKDKDLLTLMLESFYDEANESISNEELRYQLAVFFVAGHDTTAIALSAHIYYLAKYPDMQRKARQEVLDVLPTDDSITPKSKLPYLEAVMNESMRMHPPGSVLPLRCTAEDVQFADRDGTLLTVPSETMMTLDIKSLHRNAKHWANPNEFNPDRWLNDSDREAGRPAYAPFGGGARICTGMHFSLLEQRVVLSMLLRRYEWSLPKDTVHKDDIKSAGFGFSKPVPMPMHFKHYAK